MSVFVLHYNVNGPMNASVCTRHIHGNKINILLLYLLFFVSVDVFSSYYCNRLHFLLLSIKKMKTILTVGLPNRVYDSSTEKKCASHRMNTLEDVEIKNLAPNRDDSLLKKLNFQKRDEKYKLS